MIVDDEYMILEGMKCFLDYQSLHVEIVHTAENAESALQYIKENHVDIIITDVTMPGMSGLEMIQEIYQKKLTIECIVMSGYQEFDYVKKAMSLGVKNYLVKPINKEELEQTIRRIVQSKLQSASRPLDFLKGYPVNADDVMEDMACDKDMYLVASYDTIPALISLERHVQGKVIHFSIVDTLVDNIIYAEKLIHHTLFETFKTKVEKIMFYGKLGENKDMLWEIYNDIYPSILAGKVNDFLEKLPAVKSELEKWTPDVHLTQQLFIQLMMDVYQYFNRVGHEDLQTLFTSVRQYQLFNDLIQFISNELLNMIELHHYSHNVKKVLTIISQEYQSDLTLKVVSQRLFINTVYLGQIIKKETSLTFAELLNKQRVKVAQQLLLGSNDSIDLICYKVGYSNVGYFYKTFKRLCGESPKAYRKQILSLRSELNEH
nr:response regulator transcription factor [Granulicatella sp. 19428wC4_WM01]